METMNQNVDVVDLVSVLLDSGKYKEALSLHTNEKCSASFKDNYADILSLAIGKIQNDTSVTHPSLLNACEKLLMIIVDNIAPEEVLLEMIEQIEVAKNESQVCSLLPPLQKLLIKLSTKRGRSLEWCLNSITTYIETIPTPEYQLEGKQNILQDCDDNIRKVVKMYSEIPHFVQPFIVEVLEKQNDDAKDILLVFLISLMGKPIIFIDLDPDHQYNSEARVACTEIVDCICSLLKNVCKIFRHLHICYKEFKLHPKNYNQENITPFMQREKINLTTLSGITYFVLSNHFKLPDNSLPYVYSPNYLVHGALLAVIHLLDFTEYGPLSKATSLCQALLDRLPDNLSQNLLPKTRSIHFDLIKNFIHVAIYSTYESIRKSAVNLLTIHYNKFNHMGKCKIIKEIIETSNHSGIIGFAITLYKNSINESFSDPENFPSCYTHGQLFNMLKIICHLPKGVESDLVELADQIISALNLLRYLVIKDVDNITGIKGCLDHIEKEYMEVLRMALKMSKSHYELKLREIGNTNKKPNEEVEVSVTIVGSTLNNVPRDNLEEVINSALNAFHLIESLVARLSECIRMNNNSVSQSQ